MIIRIEYRNKGLVKRESDVMLQIKRRPVQMKLKATCRPSLKGMRERRQRQRQTDRERERKFKNE